MCHTCAAINNNVSSVLDNCRMSVITKVVIKRSVCKHDNIPATGTKSLALRKGKEKRGIQIRAHTHGAASAGS